MDSFFQCVMVISTCVMIDFRITQIHLDELLLEPPAPFDGVAGVAEAFPVEPAVFAVAFIALQGVFFRLDHVSGRPIHPGLSKAEIPAVFEPGNGFSQFESIIPVEICPETIRSSSDWCEQVIVARIVGLASRHAV